EKAIGNKEEREKYKEHFQEKYEADIHTSLFMWIGKEFGRSIVKNPEGEYFHYAVFATRDKKEARQSLNSLAASINSKLETPEDTMVYRGFEVGQLNDEYLIPMLFGKRFSRFQTPFYVVIDEYVVFSKTEEGIQYAVNNYLLNNSLDQNEHYTSFARKMAGQANVYMYYNLYYAFDYLLPLLNAQTADFSTANKEHLLGIPMGGFQYQFQNGKVYTNFYVKSDTASMEELSSQWQVALEAPLAEKPQFIFDHRTNSKKIVAFDQQDQMYLIDLNGNIEWKIKLDEQPLGEIEMIDFYGNNKHQILFSTPSYIYCVALNGKILDAFPVETPVKNTSPVVAFDYKKDQDYRLLVAGADRKLYNYKKDGREVRGWKTPATDQIVVNKIQRFVIDDKDFIIVADTAGNVSFFNRKGEERIVPEPAFTNDINTPFFEISKDGARKMVTTDKAGRLIFIDDQGQVEKITLNEFSPFYAFACKDFNNDGNKDFIYLDNNFVYIYDKSYSVVFKQQINENIFPGMEYLSLNDTSSALVIREKINKELLFVTQKGVDKMGEDALISDFLPLIYENPVKRSKNVVLFYGKRLESVPIR
ncbi:MAG: hypothetical protein R6U19_04550, partial [Bacteroidales bacterium]